MQTSPACLPCLKKQAEYTLRLAVSDPEKQREILAAAENYLERIDHRLSPPENASGMYQLIAHKAQCPDPFNALKQESNTMAVALRERVREKTAQSPDPLLAAIKFAIAGNIIDYGAHHDFDIVQTMENCQRNAFGLDDYILFRGDLAKAENILFLADNCGEIIFDDLLIRALGKKTTLVVKEGPVINDATLNDLQSLDIAWNCRITSNGTACPGTPLARCSSEFLSLFQRADLIISKGQGNFETLSETDAPIYFLLTVKCQVVADHLREMSGVPTCIGQMILKKQQWGIG